MSKYVSRDYAQEFTNKVISILEGGEVAPWRKPWKSAGGNGFRNLKTNRPYSGVNVFILMVSAWENGFSSPYWLTLKQAGEMGGKVKKGSHGTPITFFKEHGIEDKDTGEEKTIFFRKFFTVFNLDQIEGIEIEPAGVVGEESSDDENKLSLESYLSDFSRVAGIGYRVGGSVASYSPSLDLIRMPDNFTSVSGYCGTLAHEYIHSTGHKNRLNRFTDAALNTAEYRAEYAAEELVAELGAGLLCGSFGIEGELENHASYLAGWLKALKGDKEFIFRAASAAQKAVNFIADTVESSKTKAA